MKILFTLIALLIAWGGEVKESGAASTPPSRFSSQLESTDVLVVGWEHVRESLIPGQLEAETEALVSAGLGTFIFEVPNTYQPQFDAGDFTYFYRTRGARRVRIARALRQAGVAIIAGDESENLLAFDVLAKRKKDKKAYRSKDEAWLAARNAQFVDQVGQALSQRPGKKVMLLIGASHLGSLVKELKKKDIRVRAISTIPFQFVPRARDDNVPLSTSEEALAEVRKDVAAALQVYRDELDRLFSSSDWTSCPTPRPRTSLPAALQQELYGLREYDLVMGGNRRSSALRPLELIFGELNRLASDYPPLAIQPRDLLKVSAPYSSSLVWIRFEASRERHVYEETVSGPYDAVPIRRIAVQDPGFCHYELR